MLIRDAHHNISVTQKGILAYFALIAQTESRPTLSDCSTLGEKLCFQHPVRSVIYTQSSTQFHTVPTISECFQWLVRNVYGTCSALFQTGCSGPNPSHTIICSVMARPCWRASLFRPPSAFMTVSRTVKTKRAVKNTASGWSDEEPRHLLRYLCKD